MIGAGGALVILEVARHAICAERRILPVGVAQGAGDRGVCAGQWKFGGVVIELRAEPLRGVVAQLAILREPGGDVIRVIGGLVVLQVARRAGGAQGRILTARMTLGAGRRRMLSGKRELGGVVIEGGSQPLGGGVAELTTLRKTGRDVIGAGGGLVVLQVAGHAVGTDVGVVAVGMALQARDRDVSPGKRKLRQVVIEGRAVPGGSVMASGAIVRKSRGHVVGVGGLREIGEVATRAIARHALEMVAHMAGVARQILVCAGESEIRKASVIEVRDLPAIHVVAGFARRGETSGTVIQNTVLLKFAGVATEALRAEPYVLPHRRAHVAGIARERSVCAQQRETIPMVLNRSRVYAPTQNCVTVFTMRSKLALVKIRMAIRATHADIGKDFRYVARITRYVLVHAAKLEVSFNIVIELGLRTQR